MMVKHQTVVSTFSWYHHDFWELELILGINQIHYNIFSAFPNSDDSYVISIDSIIILMGNLLLYVMTLTFSGISIFNKFLIYNGWSDGRDETHESENEWC